MKQKEEIETEKTEEVEFFLQTKMLGFLREKQLEAKQMYKGTEQTCYLYCYPLKSLVEEAMIHLGLTERSFKRAEKYIKYIKKNIVKYCSKSRITMAAAIIRCVCLESMLDERTEGEYVNQNQISNLLNCSKKSMEERSGELWINVGVMRNDGKKKIQ